MNFLRFLEKNSSFAKKNYDRNEKKLEKLKKIQVFFKISKKSVIAGNF